MSKTDLLLHIGLMKTGSTSIQRIMRAEREELTRQGVCPLISLRKHMLDQIQTLVAKVAKENSSALVGEGQAITRRIATEVRRAGNPRLFIASSEMIASNCSSAEEIAQLGALLKPLFSRVRILIYLRRQDLHKASMYTQSLRSRGIPAPPQLRTGDRVYDYDALLRRWATVFGEDNIVPRIFEREALLNGDVVDDFMGVVGVNLPLPSNHPLRESNPSLSVVGQALLRRISAHLRRRRANGSPPDMPVWPHLQKTVSKSFVGRGWRPAPEEARNFMRTYEASNEAVRKRYFPDRPRLFSDRFEPEIPAEPSAEEVMEASLRLAVEQARDALLDSANAWMKLAALARESGREREAQRYQRAAQRINPNAAAEYKRRLPDEAALDAQADEDEEAEVAGARLTARSADTGMAKRKKKPKLRRGDSPGGTAPTPTGRDRSARVKRQAAREARQVRRRAGTQSTPTEDAKV